jgi:hypothetical protein
VIGGFVHRATEDPQLNGFYFFGDNCSGRIRLMKHDGSAWQSYMLLDTTLSITSFGEDEDGNLYVVDGAGEIYRIRANTEFIYLPLMVKP